MKKKCERIFCVLIFSSSVFRCPALPHLERTSLGSILKKKKIESEENLLGDCVFTPSRLYFEDKKKIDLK